MNTVIRDQSKYLRFISTNYPVVTITGPRQSGKTVMARTTFPDKTYFNLENPSALDFAETDPKGFLAQADREKGCVIDEIQNAPALLSSIQVDVDNNEKTGRYILTGSHNFGLKNAVSQSLAGRTAMLKLLPFSFREAGQLRSNSTSEMIYTGFYPRIYDKNIPPVNFYNDYFKTYIERDLSKLIKIKNLKSFRTFVKLCAGRTRPALEPEFLI